MWAAARTSAMASSDPATALQSVLNKQAKAGAGAVVGAGVTADPGPASAQLHSPAPRYPALTSNVVVSQAPGRGRHLLATTNIPAGAVVCAEERAGLLLLSPARHASHCWHCLGPAPRQLHCPACTAAVFCSQHCRHQADWHAWECSLAIQVFAHDLFLQRYVNYCLSVCKISLSRTLMTRRPLPCS